MKMKKLTSILMAVIIFTITSVFPETPEVFEEDNTKSQVSELIHNIAEQYKNFDYSSLEGNLPWIIADMITYETLFPDSENILDEDQKSDAAKTIVQALLDAETPGDLSKYILALRALGYDAKNIYTSDLEYINAVEKLTDLIDSENNAVKNIYTIPYVIIALSQDESYISDEQLSWLIQSVIDTKDEWQSTIYGTDAMTPILLALTPYSEDDEDIDALCAETIEILKAEQREDGLIDGFPGCEPAATGLAICAISSLGFDPYEIKNGDKSLIDGLLSVANPELDGFPDEFSTEQGFRGLLSLYLSENKGDIMYDFRDYPFVELNVSNIEYCPVIFDVTPASAKVLVDGVEFSENNCYDLPMGMYSYSVSATGYKTTSGELEITDEDEKNHSLKTITISLSENSASSDRYRPTGKVEKEPEIEIEKDSPAEDTQSSDEGIENSDDTDSSTIELDESTFADVSAEDWYYQAVKYVYENKFFAGTDKGFEPNLPMTRAMAVTVLHRLDPSVEATNSYAFSDIPEDSWYSKSVSWAAENNLINGVSENTFSPNSDITREQLAVLLYRYAIYKGYNVTKSLDDITNFNDKDNISSYAEDAIIYAVSTGLMSGRNENTLAPTAKITRAEVATILMRFMSIEK